MRLTTLIILLLAVLFVAPASAKNNSAQAKAQLRAEILKHLDLKPEQLSKSDRNVLNLVVNAAAKGAGGDLMGMAHKAYVGATGTQYPDGRIRRKVKNPVLKRLLHNFAMAGFFMKSWSYGDGCGTSMQIMRWCSQEVYALVHHSSTCAPKECLMTDQPTCDAQMARQSQINAVDFAFTYEILRRLFPQHYKCKEEMAWPPGLPAK